MTTAHPAERRPVLVLSLAIIAVYLTLTIIQSGESFVMDEIEFPRLAEAVADTGRPVYYRGEQTPAHVGVFHPPLYGYALGGWIAMFGFSPEAVRLFGVLIMIATALLGVRIVKLLDLAGRWGTPLFLGLFLLHPFVIQSALLPDIDGTVLLFATVLLFYEVTRASRNDNNFISALRMGLALALAFAAKLTAVLVVPALFVGLILAQSLRRAIAVAGSASVIGSGVFLSAWWALATFAELPFFFPFEFAIQSGLKGRVREAGIAELLSRLVPADWTVFWLGLLLPFMAVVGTAVLIKQLSTWPERRVALMFALWSLGTVVFYSLITGPPFGFPKYYISALPAMAILGVVAVDAVRDRVTPRRFGAWSGVIVAIGLAGLSGWRFAQVADEGRYAWPGYLWIFALLLLGTIAAAAFIRRRGGWLPVAAILGLLMATVTYNLGMAAVQAVDERSVRYFPGEVGFDATVRRLQQLVGPDDPILVPKDIGSATYNRYHEQETLFLDTERLAEVLANDKVQYVVVRDDWDYSYLIFPEVEAVIEEEMDLMEEIGGFLLYQRADD